MLIDNQLVNKFPGLQNLKANFTVHKCLKLKHIQRQINSGHQMRLNIILLATFKSLSDLCPLHPVLCVAI
jgi:hypothetical protein